MKVFAGIAHLSGLTSQPHYETELCPSGLGLVGQICILLHLLEEKILLIVIFIE